MDLFLEIAEKPGLWSQFSNEQKERCSFVERFKDFGMQLSLDFSKNLKAFRRM